MLRAGLWLADRLATTLPTSVAYQLADLGGRAWHRFAPSRRALVAANLARVCAATGRPTSGRPFRALVRRAFVEHARYYLELLRAPHYDPDDLDEIVQAADWDSTWAPIIGTGAVVATLHWGNFEPFGSFLAARGLRGVAPMEEIKPPELFAFFRARRASGRAMEIIPLARAGRPMIAALRRGEIVALVADRDLAGGGVPVSFFGHPTTLPAGPATLSLSTGRPLVAAASRRVAPERFRARATLVEAPLTGDRTVDTAALITALCRIYEESIAQAPEQWWGAFQQIWPDLGPGPRDVAR